MGASSDSLTVNRALRLPEKLRLLPSSATVDACGLRTLSQSRLNDDLSASAIALGQVRLFSARWTPQISQKTSATPTTWRLPPIDATTRAVVDNYRHSFCH